MKRAWLVMLALSLGAASAQETTLETTLTLPETTLTLPEISQPEVQETPDALPIRTVSLQVRSPGNAKETVVFVPLGRQSVMVGSAQLNGRNVTEVLISLKGAYFVLPGSANGALRFSVQGKGETGPASLLVRYPQGSQETLQGAVDTADLGAALPLAGEPGERSGVIRAPQDGLALRGGHSVDVTLDVPLGQPTSGTLSVNGAPVSDRQIGETSVYTDGHTRLKFIAVPLRDGVNTVSAFGDSVRVTAGGPAAAVRVTPVGTLTADGSTPVVLKLEVLDAGGFPTGLPAVSVSVDGAEVQQTDTTAPTSGDQVRLTGGQGTLTLRPLSQPGTVTLHFDVNGHPQTERLNVTGNAASVVIVHAGGTLSAGQASFQGAASIEAPVMGGKLYVAANSQGVNAPNLPYARFPAYGDASVQSQPLKAQGKIAVRFVHPKIHAEYGQDAATDPVFGVQTGADGLNIETTGARRFGVSLTQVAGDLQTVVLTPDGSRLLRIPASAVPGSETVVVVLSSGGVEASRRTLSAGRDYVNGGGGLLEFPRPLAAFTPDGLDVRVVVSFRGGTGAASTASTASTVAGVHFTQAFAVKDLNGSVSAGGLIQNGIAAFGVHLKAEGNGGSVDALIAGSGGAAYGTLQGTYKNGPLSANVSARYEGRGYAGPGAGSPGTTASIVAGYALSPQLRVKASVQGSLNEQTLSDGVVSGNQNPTETAGTLVAAIGAAYVNAPWKAEALLRRNFTAGVFGVQLAGSYSVKGFDVTLSHAQDFGPGQSLTTASLTAQVTPEIRFGVTVNRDWNTGRTLAGLSVGGTRAGVTYTAGYDLPSEGGSLGRARLAVSTSLPISKELSADLSASGSAGSVTGKDAGLQGALGATLRYQDAGTIASLGADAVLGVNGLKFDVKAAVNVSYGLQWTLSGDALSEFGAVPGGNRLGLGAAWRGENASALGYLRYRDGSFGEDRLSAELDFEQRPDWRDAQQRSDDQSSARQETLFRPWQFRESLAVAVPLNSGATTALISGDARYWTSDRLAFGLGLGALYQANAPIATRLGVEATVVPFPGWGLTAGYNFLGFQADLGHTPTRPGFYLKLDLMLDDLKR